MEKSNLPIYTKNYGEYLQFICHTDKQVDKVNEMMIEKGNLPAGYEEWDEGEDKKFILTYSVQGAVSEVQKN